MIKEEEEVRKERGKGEEGSRRRKEKGREREGGSKSDGNVGRRWY